MQDYPKSKLNRVKRGKIRANYNVEKINTILDAGFIGYVSYVYDGRAITLPMAYGRKGDKIYLHGSQANRMLLTLLKTEEMSMTVMHLDALVLARSGLHHSVNYRSATLFGSVKNLWDGVRPMHQEELDRTLVVEMTIKNASAKIRDVGVADEPEDYDLDVWAGLVPLKQIAEYPIPDEALREKIEIPKHVLDYYYQNKK